MKSGRMVHRVMSKLLLSLLAVGLPLFGHAEEAAQATEKAQKPDQVAELPVGTLRLDETVISGNQELPKVLYILPWREPQGLPDIEVQAEFTEAEVFRRLYPPAYRRELGYFDTLKGLRQDTGPIQED
jgi:hypothetical protein